jgi:hypothetical protein
MKLILFTETIDHPACRHLMKALDRMTVPFRVITGRHALQDTMLNMSTDEALFVFLLMDVGDMDLLDEMRSQIQDRKIITILPDDSEHSHAIACSLLPRFQALLSDDLSMVAEVAARIISIESDGGK